MERSSAIFALTLPNTRSSACADTCTGKSKLVGQDFLIIILSAGRVCTSGWK